MNDLDALHSETEAALAAAADIRAWDAVRVGVLGKSGKLTAMLKELGRASPEERRERGAALNRLKDTLTGLIEARRAALDQAALDARLAAERIDATLPPRPPQTGSIHPISRTMEEIAAIFGAMGFTVGEGFDVETDWFNFGALNIPAHHPARAGPGHLLSRRRTRRPAAAAPHPDLGRADHHHAGTRAAVPRHRTWPHLPRRPRRDAFADVPPVRRHRDRPRHHARPPQGLPDRLPARVLRHRHAAGALPFELLPVHRALHGSGHRLEPQDRRTGRWRRLA